VRVVGGAASARGLSAGIGNGNLPSANIGASVFDRDGELWVGTANGLAVLYTPQNAFTGGNFEAQQLLVEADGRVQAVLAGQDITAIAVDGGNRKWVGTATAGLFVLSPDGLTQLAHYRVGTSPLPGNRITGLALDIDQGYAYVATDYGLFSLRSASVEPSERFDGALLFPNPYRPEFRGMWTVTGLVDESYVKVTTADGRRVAEGYASGGQFVWDTMDAAGNLVPSGLYQFWINNPFGTQTAVVQGLLVRP
jgi:ligand-binding sensor domain-containing protein